MSLEPATAPSQRPGGDMRRYHRTLFSVPITCHHLAAGRVKTSHGISLDISEGGIGALVQDNLRVGETVAIDLALPERVLKAVTIVRHSSGATSGFEFVHLSAEERQQIRSVAAAD